MRSIDKGLEKALREREALKNRPSSSSREEWAINVSDLSKLSAYLVAALEPKSLAAEQFKRLRTNLLRKMKSKMENTLMVTSAIRGEGKTTTSLNLAISIAQGMNETVLMIDTDLRKPGVHTHLGIDAKKGLVDYLRGDADVGELLVKTEIPKMTLIPSGHPPENPAELLDSDRMGRLMHEVKSRYQNRFIILDTSPMNVFTDSAILVPHVHGILFVVRDGVTPREYVLRAISQLDKSKIMGICLNMISAPESLQDTYYYYYDYYKSEKSEKSEK